MTRSDAVGETGPEERILHAEVEVGASRAEVWQAWTTVAGIRGFFAPAARIELRPLGAYEIFFGPSAPLGQRGGEGNVILALQAPLMLGFSWNFPPSLPELRDQRTLVTLRLAAVAAGRTRVNLCQYGWGEGEVWEQGYRYFERAWRAIVLPRLRYRFDVGPVDWDNPPDLGRCEPPHE